MAKDLFNNNATTTVTSGGTTAPAQGTTQTWTVASSSTFPAASNSSSPTTQFYVCDPAQSTELILVTNVSSNTWSVTRGADGTTPVAHTAGFTVRQVVPAAWMNKLESRDPYGEGVFNVKVYGALGDASTDDTAAFNSCISAAETYAASNGGAKVVVPPDSYKINGPVTIKGDITYDFRGAYLFNGNVFTSGGGGWHMFNYVAASGYAGESNVTVLGGVFDAKGQNASTNSGTVANAKNIFLIGDGRNYRFDGCTFRNVPSFHAMDVNGIDGLIVYNCRFEGYTDNNSPSLRNQSEAMQMQQGSNNNPCKNVRVTNCYMGPAVDGSGLGSFGKLIGSHTDTNGVYYTNMTIANNTIDSALENGIGFYSLSNSVIANNVINGANRDGIRLTAGNNSSTNQNFNVVISGNVITGVSQAGISLEASKRCSVVNNHIYDCGLGGIDLSAPYTNYPTANGTNTQPSPDNTVSGNTVIGASRTTNGAFGCINLTGANNSKNYISNNNFRKYGSANEAAAPIRIEGSGAGNCYIVQNIFGAEWSTDYLSNITNSGAAFWDNARDRYKMKTSTQDFTTMSLANVTDMVVALDGSSVYEIEFVICVKTPVGNPDCQTDWTIPSGATGVKLGFGGADQPFNTTAPGYRTRTNTAVNIKATSLTDTMTYQVATVNETQFCIEKAIVTTSSSGNLQLRCAQATSSGTNATTIDTGTHVRWRKLDL